MSDPYRPSAVELAEQIDARREELSRRWVALMQDDGGDDDSEDRERQVRAEVFAAHLSDLLGTVAAAQRGDPSWMLGESPAMLAARDIGQSLAGTRDVRALLGYRYLLEALDILLPAPSGDGGAEAAPEAARRALAPARGAVWHLTVASANAIMDAVDGQGAATDPVAVRPSAADDTIRAVRHELRNCLNNMSLTLALLGCNAADAVDPEAVDSLKEEIAAMSQIIDTLDLARR